MSIVFIKTYFIKIRICNFIIIFLKNLYSSIEIFFFY